MNLNKGVVTPANKEVVQLGILDQLVVQYWYGMYVLLLYATIQTFCGPVQ